MFFIIFFQHIFVLFIVSTLVSCFSFFARGEWGGATTCKLHDGEKKDKGNDLLSLSVV